MPLSHCHPVDGFAVFSFADVNIRQHLRGNIIGIGRDKLLSINDKFCEARIQVKGLELAKTSK